MPKKGLKNQKKNIFFVLNKYQSVTNVCTLHFSRAFQRALNKKKYFFDKKILLITIH